MVKSKQTSEQLTGTGETINATKNESLSSVEVADFTDTDPAASGYTHSDYTAMIDWGDGGSPTSGTVASDGEGGYTVSGSHEYTVAGNYSPMVTITCTIGSRTATATASADVTSLSVNTQSISGTLVQGQAFTGIVASFTDSASGTDADSYSAVIDWGDGNESNGLVTPNGSGGYDVSGTDTFGEAGTLDVEITITDSTGATQTISDTADVEGIVVTAPTTAVVQGQVVTGTVATFTDTYSSALYTAYVDFGDGNWASATVTNVSGDLYDVSGTFTIPGGGDVQPSVSIAGTDGLTTTLSGTVTAIALNTPSTPTDAVSSDGTSVTLTWTDSADSRTEFEIEQQNDDDSGTNFFWVQTLGASTYSTTISSLTEGADYSFRVRAVMTGESEYSSSLNVTPTASGAPAAPTLSISSSGTPLTFTLSWSTTPGVSYNLEFEESDSSTIAYENWAAWGYGTTFTPSYGQTYQFRVVASNGDGSSNSNVVTAAQPGSQPTGMEDLTAMWAPGSTWDDATIDLTWTFDPSAAGNDGSNFTEYWSTVQYNGTSSPASTQAINTSSENYTDNEDGTATGTMTINNADDDYYDVYTYNTFAIQVYVSIGSGSSTAVSPAQVVWMSPLPPPMDPPTPVLAPAAPTNLTAAYDPSDDDDDDDSGNTLFDLEWDNNSNNETGFTVLVSTDGGASFQAVTPVSGPLGADQTSCVVQLSNSNGFGPTGAIIFEVEATNLSIPSGPSNPVTIQALPYAINVVQGGHTLTNPNVVDPAMYSIAFFNFSRPVNLQLQEQISFEPSPLNMAATFASNTWITFNVKVPKNFYQIGQVFEADGFFQKDVDRHGLSDIKLYDACLTQCTALLHAALDAYSRNIFNSKLFCDEEIQALKGLGLR